MRHSFSLAASFASASAAEVSASATLFSSDDFDAADSSRSAWSSFFKRSFSVLAFSSLRSTLSISSRSGLELASNPLLASLSNRSALIFILISSFSFFTSCSRHNASDSFRLHNSFSFTATSFSLFRIARANLTKLASSLLSNFNHVSRAAASASANPFGITKTFSCSFRSTSFVTISIAFMRSSQSNFAFSRFNVTARFFKSSIASSRVLTILLNRRLLAFACERSLLSEEIKFRSFSQQHSFSFFSCSFVVVFPRVFFFFAISFKPTVSASASATVSFLAINLAWVLLTTLSDKICSGKFRCDRNEDEKAQLFFFSSSSWFSSSSFLSVIYLCALFTPRCAFALTPQGLSRKNGAKQINRTPTYLNATIALKFRPQREPVFFSRLAKFRGYSRAKTFSFQQSFLSTLREIFKSFASEQRKKTNHATTV